MHFLRVKADWLFYSMGFGGLFLINHALLIMLVYRYDPGSSLDSGFTQFIPSAVVGILMLTMRSTGAIAMPGIGYFSSRFSSHWGQRRPFLALATLPLALCFLLIFIPPTLGRTQLSLYLSVLLLLFYLAFGTYQVPYLAWLSAIARNPKEHVQISTYMAITSLLGTLTAGIGAPLIVERYGFTNMAITIAMLSSAAMASPLLVKESVKEPVKESVKESTECRVKDPLGKELPTLITPAKRPSFITSIRQSWHNLFFRTYIIGLGTAWVAVSMLSVCSTFIAVSLLNQSVSFGALINGIVIGGAIFGSPLVPRLVRRLGRQGAFQFSISWVGCGFLAMTLLSFTQTTPSLRLWILLLLLTSLGLAGFFALPNAMLSAEMSQQNQQSEHHQEAIYFGIRGLFVETSIGLGTCLSGLTLTLGKTAANPLGVQVSLVFAGVLALLSAYAFSYFPSKWRRQSASLET